MKYNKLVRDNVPDIIRQKGHHVTTHTASGEEFREKLDKKLWEEIEEFLITQDEEQLADILEVVYTIAESKGIGTGRLEEIRKSKAEKKGTFSKRTILDNVE